MTKLKCNTCDGPLDDTNWRPSWKATGRKQCNDCGDEYNRKSNVNRLHIGGKYIKQSDPLYKMFRPGNYTCLGDATFKQSEISNIDYGYVYIITNKAWPGWVKIGMAVDAEDRLKGYQTSSPFRDFELVHKIYSEDRRKTEQAAHKMAKLKAERTESEWFLIDVEKAVEILDKLNEHNGFPKEADTHTEKDELQEQPSQASFGF